MRRARQLLGAGARAVVKVAQRVVERVDRLGAERLAGLWARGRTEEEQRAAAQVEILVVVLGEVIRIHMAMQPVVDDRRPLRRPGGARIVRVLDQPIQQLRVDALLRRGEDVAIHLADPRRLAELNVRVAGRDVVLGADGASRERVPLRLGAVHVPVALRVGAHRFTVVQPARRDLLQVLQVKDVVPAGRARELGHALVRHKVLDEVVIDALVEVAHVLGKDHPAGRSQPERIYRRAQQHVRVDEEHVGLVDLGLAHPVHDRGRLVVRARRLVVVRVVRIVRVHERGPQVHALLRVDAPLLFGAREQTGDLALRAEHAVRVEDSRIFPHKVVRALGAEDGMQRVRH